MATHTPNRLDGGTMPFLYDYRPNNEGIDVTIDSTAGFTKGDQISFVSNYFWAVTITGSGVTIKTPPGKLAETLGSYAIITLTFVEDTVAYLSGELGTPPP